MSGSLPPGLQLQGDGRIVGTPHQRGVALVVLRATDSSSPVPQFVDTAIVVTVS
jgi:hypothetical protein